jgi:DNA-binding transcriptional LysR family regulator
MYNWDLVKAYLALTRSGSYEQGASALGIDQTTMRRRIQQLEQEMGMTLFVRSGNVLQANPASTFILDAALDMERAAIRFHHMAKSATSRGNVRITTLESLADVLAPAFVRFQHANPQIVVNVTTEPHFVDLDRDMADLALRLARPRTGENGLRKVGAVGFGVYASPDYLKRWTAKTGGALHDLIALCTFYAHTDHDFELADEQWRHHQEALGDVMIRADTYSGMLRLCEEGAGLAMLPRFRGDKSDRLVRFGDARIDLAVDLWVVIRKDMSASPKVRLLVDFITDELRRLRPLLNPVSRQKGGGGRSLPAATA